MANVLRAVGPGTDNAYGTKNLGASYTDLWMGFDIYWASFPTASYTAINAAFARSGSDLDGFFAQNQRAEIYYADNNPFESFSDNQWYHIDFRSKPAVMPLVEELWIDGVDQGVICTTSLGPGENYTQVQFGLRNFVTGGEIVYFKNMTVGTTRGASDIWAADLTQPIGTVFTSTSISGTSLLDIIPEPPPPTPPANDDFESPTILDPSAGTHNLTGLTTRDATWQTGEPVITGGDPPVRNQSVWFELASTDGIYVWRLNNLSADGNVCTQNQLIAAWGKDISSLADFQSPNINTGVFGLSPLAPRSLTVRDGETWTFVVESFRYAQTDYRFNDQTYQFDFEAEFQSYPWQPINEGSNILYAALAGPDVTTSDLYTINLATGVPTSLGPLGVAVTGLAIHPTTGDMYGVTSNVSDPPVRHLIRIDDYVAGPPSVFDLGALGISGGIGDLSFRSDGVLFGWAGSGKLYTINLATGAATQVGVATLSGAFGAAIDFDGSTLYGLVHGDTGNVYTINTTTGVASAGAAISDAPMAFDDSPFAAAAFSLSEGKFYAVDNDYGDGAALVTIDTTTGVVSTTGILFNNGVDAICWGEAPPLIALPPTDVRSTSATLQGTANPQGIGIFAWFEYGLTTSYGSSTTHTYVGDGTDPVPVAASVSGLTPETAYHYRVAAEPGAPPAGDEFTYTVNPKGVSTTVFVDYGLDPKSLTSTTTGVGIGSGSSDVSGSVSASSLGLSDNTVYFYRVRAVNAQGSSVSNTLWLKTPSVGGTTRHVGSGQTYASIPAALAAAAAGDTIVVHAGSYGTQNITQSFGGLVSIVRNGADVVTIDNAQLNGATNLYWGPGFTFTGASFPAYSGSHLIDLTGTNHIYFDGITSAYGGAATGDCSPLWVTTDSDYTFVMDSTFSGGGVMKGYTGNPSAPSQWPAHSRFLSCSFSGQSSDIWHFDGMTDWFYEDCTFSDPNPVPIPAEHHDGIQVAYGSTLTVRRCTFTWAGANQNGNNQAMIMGDFGAAIAACTVENVLVNGWNGCSMNTQGAVVKYRNITTYHCKGVVGGSSTQQNEDFIMGASGDQIDMANVIAYKPFTNGSATSITGDHNLVESGSTNISGFLTNTATGTAQYVSAGSNFHPTLGGNLDRTGVADAYTPLWDRDGRGYGPTMSKGCYAPTDVTTPIVVAAGYTP